MFIMCLSEYHKVICLGLAPDDDEFLLLFWEIYLDQISTNSDDA